MTATNLPEVSVDTIKDALRIDGNDDDTLIKGYIDTAKDYVANAVIDGPASEPLTSSLKYRLAVIILVQFWYSNRATDMKQTPYQVRSLIQQLRGKFWQ
ncbi:phage gp6-like head-tail connector protein [Lactobacillus reuteri]|uniref:head-tail connector protein n=1 Tax=Limosilactobacillus reuteri TaxID=1598 RepID=UPI00146B016B|nr:head-tail connector protein [Limosilactobacillus reuteri]NMV51839.1 phage gp6-like head-tail connector protein [Limosilactobacillus reuteri]NMV55500.1 phage gp6-like head-tail connector protein [Limosilactobacillus reuteri]NMV65198.1 phage gp6-like head-tail connector protein [Limosilactobacillus reuteri]